jgi:hypothetical protein
MAHAFVVRREDQNEWTAEAEGGDEEAEICLWAVRKYMNALPNTRCCFNHHVRRRVVHRRRAAGHVRCGVSCERLCSS